MTTHGFYLGARESMLSPGPQPLPRRAQSCLPPNGPPGSPPRRSLGGNMTGPGGLGGPGGTSPYRSSSRSSSPNRLSMRHSGLLYPRASTAAAGGGGGYPDPPPAVLDDKGSCVFIPQNRSRSHALSHTPLGRAPLPPRTASPQRMGGPPRSPDPTRAGGLPPWGLAEEPSVTARPDTALPPLPVPLAGQERDGGGSDERGAAYGRLQLEPLRTATPPTAGQRDTGSSSNERLPSVASPTGGRHRTHGTVGWEAADPLLPPVPGGTAGADDDSDDENVLPLDPDETPDLDAAGGLARKGASAMLSAIMSAIMTEEWEEGGSVGAPPWSPAPNTSQSGVSGAEGGGVAAEGSAAGGGLHPDGGEEGALPALARGLSIPTSPTMVQRQRRKELLEKQNNLVLQRHHFR